MYVASPSLKFTGRATLGPQTEQGMTLLTSFWTEVDDPSSSTGPGFVVLSKVKVTVKATGRR